MPGQELPPDNEVQVKKVKFSPLQPLAGAQGAGIDYNYLKEVYLEITAELGQCSMTVREVLDLQEGSLITLDKLAGEHTTLYVNQRPLGIGEVVVINDIFAIKVQGLAAEKSLDGEENTG